MQTTIEPITFGTLYKQPEEQSIRSAALVLQEVQKRFPAWATECDPYRNVLTFREWKARGYTVKKGEKSIRIPIMREIEDKDDPEAKHLVRKTACLFALPQVEREKSDEWHDHAGKPSEDCPICQANRYQ